MDTNKIILRNRKLSPRMKFFASEIDRLTRLYESIRTPGRDYNVALAHQIKQIITEAKEEFKDIYEFSEDQVNRKKKRFTTANFISMIGEFCKKIEDTFEKLNLNEHK